MYAPEAKVESNPFLAGIAAVQAAKPVELWPENERAINLFTTLSTQWRIGMNGATGLDYSPFFARMDRMRLSDDDYEILFDDIRIIESEALQIMNKKTD